MADNNYEAEIFTLTDENGNEIDFEIIGQHEMNGEHYVALLPAEEEEKDGGQWEYIVLKLAKEGDEEILVTVDDDDEFEAIAAYFDDLFASEIDYD
ncbi:MAG: DUF1292 domain-containing protein [Ruminococcaceae bacterium]|nr:DUF1292 domain-containing protein [Oscillospiraceae bacterium]